MTLKQRALLRRFCACSRSAGSQLWHFTTPFQQGYHAYGTDGAICVRVRCTSSQERPHRSPNAAGLPWAKHRALTKLPEPSGKDHLRFCGRPFAVHYWRRICRLPEVKGALVTGTKLPMLYFRFKGGEGLLMGLDLSDREIANAT